MPWVKLTDDFTEHPKLLAAGPLAGWLWISSLAWSNRNGTDGRIPRAQVLRLASFDGVGVYTGNYSGEDVDARRLADVLVDVGLWEPVDGGFVIHDYSEYQLTVAELERRSEAKRRAGQAGGLASGRARAQASASARAQAETKPVSRNPKTIPQSSSGNSRANGAAVDNPDDDDVLAAVPAEVWVHYADLMLAKQPAGTVKQPAAWKRRTRENANVEHGDTAARWWDQYRLTPAQLAQHLVDGTAPRNEYRRKAET